MNLGRKIIKLLTFYSPKLSREAFEAYLNKLPDKIEVEWFRDGNFIVGDIDADGYKFMTQAKDAEEFIKMVNHTLFDVYEIPEDYAERLFDIYKFAPKDEELERLNNGLVKKSAFHSKKRLAIVR